MSRIRHLLAAAVATAALAGLAARADTKQGDPRVVLEDGAARQAALKRAFEQFRGKLAVLAGRLEASDDAKDRDKARALRAALKEASSRSMETKFDSLIRALASKNADRDLDVLAGAIKENKELRQDLQKLIALLSMDDRDKVLARNIEDAKKLLEALKDLRDKQARMQARTELSKDSAKDLEKGQEKLTEKTKELLDKLDKKDDKANSAAEEGKEKLAEAVKKPVGEANKKQKESEGKLGKGDRDGAGESQGKAVDKLDEAIRRVNDIIEQHRHEERERKLMDLLARAKKMLKAEEQVQEGTEVIFRELRKEKDGKATTAQAARVNKLADVQLENLRDAEAALKVIRAEGSAIAFEEVFDQMAKDMDVIHNRLTRVEVDKVTLTVIHDVIETLKDIIKALEKAINENQPPNQPKPPRGYGPTAPPKLVDLLQQLKMIHALQKRVNARTELYGKRYAGEQLPRPKDDREKSRYERIARELKDLSGRQEKIGKVTREIDKEIPGIGRQID